MATLSKASLDFLEALGRSIGETKTAVVPSSIESDTAAQAQLDVAAVLHVFTPQDLPMAAESETAKAAAVLRRASYPAPGYRLQRARSLKAQERQTALRRIGDGARARSLIATSPERILTPAQRLFESMLADREIDIGALPHSDLIALREANQWMAHLSQQRFSDSRLDIAIQNAVATASVEHLLKEHFIGREDIIAQLHQFAGIRERGVFDRLADFVLNRGDRLLMIEGPGGIGKTAVIGHFLFRSRADSDGPLFPFAYLPCDDSSIDVNNADVLLSEVARQFEQLVSVRRKVAGKTQGIRAFDAQYEEFQSKVLAYRKRMQGLAARRSEMKSQDARLSSSRDSLGVVVRSFGRLLDAACAALKRKRANIPPAVIFIDTFEEVQYRAREDLDAFWSLLQTLFAQSDRLRVLISGRAPLATPRGIPQRKITLDELEPEAAIELLRRETGLPRHKLEPVIQQIGGNPLNLRLAARILANDESRDEDGIAELTTRRFGLFRLSPEIIRGRLYRRLLERIHDEDVRKLAHPGMILRRVDAKVIREVLVPVCGMPEISASRADELFDELVKEHTLVRVDDDQSLRFREDVRAPVMALLAADEPLLTQRMHEAAWRYYRNRGDAISVAEFVYHGLMSGIDEYELDRRWRPEAARYLTTALPEVPPEGRIWLATRMDVEISPELSAGADLAAWEKITARKVISLLENRGSREALHLLQERRERTKESPLFVVEARCLLSLERPGDAAGLLRSALAEYPIHGNRGRNAEMLWLLQQAESMRGDKAAAIAALDALIELAATLPSRLSLVQALAARIDSDPREGINGAHQLKLLGALRSLSDDEILREQDVVRTGFAALHVDMVGETTHIIRLIASSVLDVVASGRLALQEWWLDALVDLLKAIEPDDDAAGLGRVVNVLQTPTITSAQLLNLVEVAVRAVSGERDVVPKRGEVRAAQAIWILLQMETGDLSAATLAGLDDFRADWERAASAVAAA